MSWRRWVIIIFIFTGCMAGAGCSSGLYEVGRAEASVISPRSTWKVAGDLRFILSAVDQNVATAALSPDREGKGTLTIDLGKPCVFNMAVIEHGPDEMGFARRVAILTSMDGEVFIHRYAGPGTRRVTILYLGAPVMARYVRLQVLVGGDRPWSVAEVSLQ